MKFTLLVLCPTMLLLACGGEDDADVDLQGGCDITRAACQRAIFEATAEIRGTDAPMPPVRTVSLEEFEEWLTSQVGTGSDEPDVWSRTLPLLRLLPEGSSVGNASVTASVAGVAAYYHPGSKQVTVIDRGISDPLDGLLLLAHEFVHSLQDASLDIRAFRDAWASTLDSSVAVTTLLEGEATVLGLGVLAKALRRPPGSLNWANATSAMRERIFQQIEASPAPFFTALQALPYPLGTSQLSSLWLSSGQPAIDALYSAPPLSVLDWSDNSRVTAPTRLERLDCLPTAGPPGFVGDSHDAFGPTGLLAARLDQGEAVDRAWANALAFRGDRVVVFSDAANPDSHSIAWRIRFESESAAQSFGSAASLRLASGAAVVVQSREVVYYGTTNPDQLVRWTEATHCGTEEELPSRTDDSQMQEADSIGSRLRGLEARPQIRGTALVGVRASDPVMR